MSHCYSVGVNIDGQEQEICTTHVPGNETLARDIEERGPRPLTQDEIKRSVESL